MTSNAHTDVRVLVVEDDRIARESLAALLAQMGMVVTKAKTLEQAMARLNQRFDIVCLDLILPDGDGVDLLRHIRRNRIATKVAVISGANEPNTLAEVTLLKPEAIFGKPLDIDDFSDWLREQGVVMAEV